MINTISSEQANDEVGNKMRSLIAPLLQNGTECDVISNIDSSYWKTANRFILTMLPMRISWKVSSLKSMADPFFVAPHDTDFALN